MNLGKMIIALATILLVTAKCMFAQVLIPSSGDSNRIASLNGTWKFKYVPSSVLKNDSLFYKPDFDISNWANIKTPGNWELQGFAKPIYGKKIKEGTGLYRTHFTVPADWKQNPVYIAFDGVQSGYSVWVNGQYAGSFASSFNRE